MVGEKGNPVAIMTPERHLHAGAICIQAVRDVMLLSNVHENFNSYELKGM